MMDLEICVTGILDVLLMVYVVRQNVKSLVVEDAVVEKLSKKINKH